MDYIASKDNRFDKEKYLKAIDANYEFITPNLKLNKEQNEAVKSAFEDLKTRALNDDLYFDKDNVLHSKSGGIDVTDSYKIAAGIFKDTLKYMKDKRIKYSREAFGEEFAKNLVDVNSPTPIEDFLSIDNDNSVTNRSKKVIAALDNVFNNGNFNNVFYDATDEEKKSMFNWYNKFKSSYNGTDLSENLVNEIANWTGFSGLNKLITFTPILNTKTENDTKDSNDTSVTDTPNTTDNSPTNNSAPTAELKKPSSYSIPLFKTTTLVSNNLYNLLAQVDTNKLAAKLPSIILNINGNGNIKGGVYPNPLILEYSLRILKLKGWGKYDLSTGIFYFPEDFSSKNRVGYNEAQHRIIYTSKTQSAKNSGVIKAQLGTVFKGNNIWYKGNANGVEEADFHMNNLVLPILNDEQFKDIDWEQEFITNIDQLLNAGLSEYEKQSADARKYNEIVNPKVKQYLQWFNEQTPYGAKFNQLIEDNKDFFQGSSNGITNDKISNGVLGYDDIYGDKTYNRLIAPSSSMSMQGYKAFSKRMKELGYIGMYKYNGRLVPTKDSTKEGFIAFGDDNAVTPDSGSHDNTAPDTTSTPTISNDLSIDSDELPAPTDDVNMLGQNANYDYMSAIGDFGGYLATQLANRKSTQTLIDHTRQRHAISPTLFSRLYGDYALKQAYHNKGNDIIANMSTPTYSDAELQSRVKLAGITNANQYRIQGDIADNNAIKESLDKQEKIAQLNTQNRVQTANLNDEFATAYKQQIGNLIASEQSQSGTNTTNLIQGLAQLGSDYIAQRNAIQNSYKDIYNTSVIPADVLANMEEWDRKASKWQIDHPYAVISDWEEYIPYQSYKNSYNKYIQRQQIILAAKQLGKPIQGNKITFKYSPNIVK